MLSPSTSRTYARVGVLGGAALISFLLVSRYELSQPQNRPNGITELGGQAWQLTFEAKKAGSGGNLETAMKQNSTSTGGGGGSDEYWDEEDESDYWSITSNRKGWDPLRADTTPFTELALKTCVLSPGLYDLCSPTSTPVEDQKRGKWERIDRDVSKKVGIYYLYLYGRRLLPGSSSDVITDLAILPDDKPSSGWVSVPESLRTGVWPRIPPVYLHYRLTPQADILAARKMDEGGDAGELEPITEIDVLYGDDKVHALPGFKKLEPLVTGGKEDPRAIGTGYGKSKKGPHVGSGLAYRKQIPTLPTTPLLRFSSNGNFTILQVADLHFSVGPGECRDLDPLREEECREKGADVYSLEWLETALDEVKPDLVVLTGDQLNGQETSWDARSVILKWSPLLYERQIPWTTVFGNHDEQTTDLDHEKQMDLMRKLPYFIGQSGPSNVDGTGNYRRSIRAPEEDTVLFNLYFLDSHAEAPSKIKIPFVSPGYDYLKPNQINWFRGQSAQVKPIMRPYSPSTPSSAFSTKKRPSRPRPAATPSPEELDDDLVKRQVDEESWSEAAVDELSKLEEEMLENGSGGFSPVVEPDDGSNIVVNPSSSSYTEDEELLDENENFTSLESQSSQYLPKPFVLPAGPTRSNPMEAKPNGMVFFHIPLQQAYTAEIDVGPSGKQRLVIGNRNEAAGASKTDSMFFQNALLAQGELLSKGQETAVVDEFWDGESSAPTEGRPEVKVLAHGHCHLTSDCRRVQGVWQCFGGGGTYSGYGRGSFPRRFRVFRLSEFGEKIETEQLLDTKEVINHAVLVGEGSLEETM
ncbi:uncharacterized protein JCM6883_004327 [Sporobolomyces salmoneus]|uniref:uncharacterized protein n=1 Tax=Sporobolomyces salmoneus TaxID=183962 RepID=UPI00317C5730